MKILLLTNNSNKVIEYKNLLPYNFNIFTLKTENIDYNPIEDGSSFKENLNIKLNNFDLSKYLDYDYLVAEDSGLCVEELNGNPGIYSKRFSGQGDDENNNLLISKMKNKKNRSAYYYALIGLKNTNTNVITYFEGRCAGNISDAVYKGKNGFAYDNIFIPSGYDMTFSNLEEKVKTNLSHRSIGVEKLVKFLKEK